MHSSRIDPTKCFDRVRYRPQRSVKHCDVWSDRNQDGIDFPERSLVSITFSSSFVNVSTGRAASRSAVIAAPNSVRRNNTYRLSERVHLSALQLSPLAEQTRENLRATNQGIISTFLFCVPHSHPRLRKTDQ